MMSLQSKEVLKRALFHNFCEAYGFYMSDVERCKRFPDIFDKEFCDFNKSLCDEIITAFVELCDISYKEAEDMLVGYYTRMKIREKKKEVA